jgi:hypothetical protein
MTSALIAMRAQGKTLREIARALGVSHSVAVARAVLGRLLPRRRRVVLRDVRRLPGEPEPLGGVAEIMPRGVCHWVVGDVAGHEWRMCGHRSVHGGSWCAHHRARVYDPSPSFLRGRGDGVRGHDDSGVGTQVRHGRA